MTEEIVEAILPARYVKSEQPELCDAWPYAMCDQDRSASVRYYQAKPHEYVAVYTSLIEVSVDRALWVFRARADHWDAGTRIRLGSESFYLIPQRQRYPECYERIYAHLFDCIVESEAITDSEFYDVTGEKEQALLNKLQAMSEANE